MEGQIKTIFFGILICLVFFCVSELEAKELSNSIESEFKARSLEENFGAADQCKCKNGFCEKNSEGKLVCKCPSEWGLDPADGGTCKKCDCGKGANCTFTSSFFGVKRTCICEKGSFLKSESGSCQKCNCGKDFDCKSSFLGLRQCLCDKGYTARNGVCVEEVEEADCNEEYPNCLSTGGTCVQTKDGIICKCPDDIILTDKDGKCDKCNAVKCLNGGKCDINGGKALCNCTERFTGNNCQTDKCNAVKCLNGGKCDIKGGKALCNCTERFTGNNCQTVVSTTKTTITNIGSTANLPSSTLKEFPSTPEPNPSTMAPSTEVEKKTYPSSTESTTVTTRTTTTSPTLELIKSLVVKILIYQEKI